MTTIPGHNQVMQQSGMAQEVNNQAHSPKPGPDQAAVIQQAQETIQNTTVQGSNESDRMKEEKEKAARKAALAARKKRKKAREEDVAMDPEATGRMLDTTA